MNVLRAVSLGAALSATLSLGGSALASGFGHPDVGVTRPDTSMIKKDKKKKKDTMPPKDEAKKPDESMPSEPKGDKMEEPKAE